MPTSSRRPRPIPVILVGAAAAVVVGLVVTGVASALGAPRSAAAVQPTAQPADHQPALPSMSPLPIICDISFTGTGIATAPLEQTMGKLYSSLPIPTRQGEVFAGWYRSASDATALRTAARVNGAQVVDCPASHAVTLHGAWMTAAAVAKEKVRVPILMYHQFTTKPAGEAGPLKANDVYIGDFEADMAYVSAQKLYLPTWDELSAFIDGRLYLPHQSVVITDDDADPTWESLAVPIVEKYKVLTTSFVITKDRQAPSPSIYVLQRSQTNDMHSADANGKGKMVNSTVPQIVADLDASATVLEGVKQVLAYPFGQFDATAVEGVRQAGFELAVTTNPGDVQAGSPKLELPRERVSFGMTMAEFRAIVG